MGRTIKSMPDQSASDADIDNLFSGKESAEKSPKSEQELVRESKPIPQPVDQPSAIFKPADSQQGGKFPPLPQLGKGFEEVAIDIFERGFDVAEEYKLIERSLSIKGALTPGAIAEAANNTEEMARRAYQLYVIAKIEYGSYIRETDAVVAAIRDAASSQLERQKARGIRHKMITDADVIGASAQQYPDEWRAVSDRRERAKRMIDYLSNLAELAKSRCFTASKMLSPGGKL